MKEMLWVGMLVCTAVSCTLTPPLLRSIDHFFATSHDPEPLYRIFRDSLQWPEVYPFRDYGDFASGVVSVGNVLFEVVTWKVPAGEILPTELKGIAFEPGGDVSATLAELRERGMPYQKPDSVMFTNDSGVTRLAYVNVPLDGPGGLPPSTASIFINDNLKSTRTAARRQTEAEELERWPIRRAAGSDRCSGTGGRSRWTSWRPGASASGRWWTSTTRPWSSGSR